MRLGHFDPAGPLQSIPEASICSGDHAVTAAVGLRILLCLLSPST